MRVGPDVERNHSCDLSSASRSKTSAVRTSIFFTTTIGLTLIQQFESRLPPVTDKDKHLSDTDRVCPRYVSFCLWLSLTAHQIPIKGIQTPIIREIPYPLPSLPTPCHFSYHFLAANVQAEYGASESYTFEPHRHASLPSSNDPTNVSLPRSFPPLSSRTSRYPHAKPHRLPVCSLICTQEGAYLYSLVYEYIQ